MVRVGTKRGKNSLRGRPESGIAKRNKKKGKGKQNQLSVANGAKKVETGIKARVHAGTVTAGKKKRSLGSALSSKKSTNTYKSLAIKATVPKRAKVAGSSNPQKPVNAVVQPGVAINTTAQNVAPRPFVLAGPTFALGSQPATSFPPSITTVQDQILAEFSSPPETSHSKRAKTARAVVSVNPFAALAAESSDEEDGRSVTPMAFLQPATFSFTKYEAGVSGVQGPSSQPTAADLAVDADISDL